MNWIDLERYGHFLPGSSGSVIAKDAAIKSLTPTNQNAGNLVLISVATTCGDCHS
jgi:hypothetical protein